MYDYCEFGACCCGLRSLSRQEANDEWVCITPSGPRSFVSIEQLEPALHRPRTGCVPKGPSPGPTLSSCSCDDDAFVVVCFSPNSWLPTKLEEVDPRHMEIIFLERKATEWADVAVRARVVREV